VNIQGDEPLIDPAVIDAVAARWRKMKCPPPPRRSKIRRAGQSERRKSRCQRRRSRVIFFPAHDSVFARGRQPSGAEQLAAFPFLKHLGIYGYRRETLLRLVKFPVSPLENAEKLEQLRALENGIQIAVVKVDYDSIGVDVPEDVAGGKF
jgi:3-deoxy-manno-octulosonate cytidylyltransferase (CMP-KDO synthetase)